MTLAGWLFMLLSWGAIIWLMVFSYAKILRPKPPKKKAK